MDPEANILTGIAGEYFVAGELSRRGYIASITLRNTAHIDLHASNKERAVRIQVKTKCIDTDGWKMGDKPLENKGIGNDIFYIFVEVSTDPKNKQINYYIIPKKELNIQVEDNFLKWKAGKKSNGKPRKSNLRVFRMEEYQMFNMERYKDNWDILFG